jgi:hypothetical protein
MQFQSKQAYGNTQTKTLSNFNMSNKTSKIVGTKLSISIFIFNIIHINICVSKIQLMKISPQN